MKNRSRCLFVFILLAAAARAQPGPGGSIAGSIKEQISGKAIDGATVWLKPLAKGALPFTLASDRDGHFIFILLTDGRYILTVTHAGRKTYNSDTLYIEDKNRALALPPIVLMADTGRLQEVIVQQGSSDYIEQRIDRTVVNIGALPSNSGSNALDVLNTLPGVLADENGSISFRGREGVVVYIDDKPTHLSGTDLTNYLKSLPSSQLDKMEIISNPPARYEAEGATGIINIRTRKIKGRHFNGNGSLNLGMGHYFRSNNSINLNYRNNKLNVSGAMGWGASKKLFYLHRQRNYQYLNNTSNYQIDQQINETSYQYGFTYRLGVDYDLSKYTSVGILFNGSGSPYHETGIYTSRFAPPPATPDSTVYSQSAFKKSAHNNAIDLSFRHSFNTRERVLSANLDWLGYTANGNQTLQSDTWLPSDSLAGIYTLISTTPLSARIYGMKADYTDKMAKNIVMELGAQAVWSIRNNRSDYYNKTGNTLYPNQALDNTFRYKENINAAYISFRQDFPRFSWQAGLRVEQTQAQAASFDTPLKPDTSFTLRYTNLFPTLYLSYKPDSNAKSHFVFSAGRRISRPGYQSLNPAVFFFDRNTSIGGNSLLQPEFSTNLELSYSIGSPLMISLLYSNTDNIITTAYKQVENTFVSTQVNIHRFVSTGISASSSIQVRSCWSVNLYTELIQTSYKGALFGGEMYLDNHWLTFRLSGSNQFKFRKGWSADITGAYRSRDLSAQSLRQPDWALDAGLQKKFNDRVSLSLSARDIFNSWPIKRTVTIPHASVLYEGWNDTRQIGLTFTRRFGKQVAAREKRTGIQSESERL